MEKFIIISLIAVMGWISYSQYTEDYQDKVNSYTNSEKKKVLTPVRKHSHMTIEIKSPR